MNEVIRSLLRDESFRSTVKFNTRYYNENEKIIFQGNNYSNLFMIRSGYVRVIVTGHLNKSVDLHPGIYELGPDDIFGEFSMFDGMPASTDVIAVSEVELIEIDQESLRKFMRENPKKGYLIVFELFAKLVKQLRHSNEVVARLYTSVIKVHSLDRYL